MQIKIIYDKDSLNKNLNTGWGVSFLIGEKILFDTGENGEWLMDNLKKLDIDINKLESVVISHDHWDHKGGLWELLKENQNLKIYACANFSERFKNKVKSFAARLIECDGFVKITENIYSTGEIEGRYLFNYIAEQSLVLKTENGLTVVTGCAHPGIIKIIEKVKENMKEDIHLVIGGFHLMDKQNKFAASVVEKFKELNVKNVAPTHCTGEAAIGLFQSGYKANFVPVKVGETITV